MIFAFVCFGISAFCFIILCICSFAYYKKPDKIEQMKEKLTSSNLFGIILTVLGVIAIIISIILIVSVSSEIGIYLFAIGLIPLILGGRMVKNNKKKMEINELGLRFIENGTLEITNRNPAISKFVKIKADSDAIVKYEPVKLHIGSATVGGVTTGGAYTTGGYNYLAGKKKNGKYILTAFGETIFRIQLNDEQYLSAKQSKISKYLNDKHQIEVIVNVYITDEELKSMIQNLQKSSYLNGGETMKKGYPSYEKCKYIRDWLCGVDKKIEDENIDNE
ncbi:MAG: hypothetical protein UFA98_01365 [Ruminococcus sp.]|nr:hypothetical protein [Ruminococcus sp.]